MSPAPSQSEPATTACPVHTAMLLWARMLCPLCAQEDRRRSYAEQRATVMQTWGQRLRAEPANGDESLPPAG